MSSVRVVPAPVPPHMLTARTAVFAGDDELLLDRMIAASQEHKLKTRLPGYGRELVPYFPTTPAPFPASEARVARTGSKQSNSPNSKRKHRKSGVSEESAQSTPSVTPGQSKTPRSLQTPTPTQTRWASASYTSPPPSAVPLPSFIMGSPPAARRFEQREAASSAVRSLLQVA
eukprot:jgi/Chlat1/1851/Chrsp141S02189